MNERVKNFSLRIDTVKSTFDLHTSEDQFLLKYEKSENGILRLAGPSKQDSVSITMKWLEEKEYLLVQRKFHWINEYPFNY